MQKVKQSEKMTTITGITAILEPLNNETIRIAVNDYLEGGDHKAVIITKYGKIEDWDVSKVTNMSTLFERSNFNEDISKWDTSNVTNMFHMFYYAKSFNQDISKWNTSNVNDTHHMFFNAKSFDEFQAPWYDFGIYAGANWDLYDEENDIWHEDEDH